MDLPGLVLVGHAAMLRHWTRAAHDLLHSALFSLLSTLHGESAFVRYARALAEGIDRLGRLLCLSVANLSYMFVIGV